METADQDGGKAARNAYRERQTRFGHLPWLAVPRETELRVACRALDEQKRTEDAIETCKLNTEINPSIWNMWFNLARLQRGQALTKVRTGRRTPQS